MTFVKTAAIMLLIFFTTVLRVEAQDDDPVLSEKGEAKKPNHSHQTYLKGGWSHIGTEIEGFDIVVNGLSVDLETYFNSVLAGKGGAVENHFGLSGWFLGYRKDDLTFFDFGHVLNIGVFRTVNIPVSAKIPVPVLKIGGGLEWGTISSNFSKTHLSYENGELTSYEHIFPYRNIDIPGSGPSYDSDLYPFVEAGILKRWNRFLVEAGLRGNIQRFGFDKYVLNGDELDFTENQKTKVIYSFFIKFGFTIGGDKSAKKPKVEN